MGDRRGSSWTMALMLRNSLLKVARTPAIRSVVQPAKRMMSSEAMPEAENLAMQRLYPMYRSSWFGYPGGNNNWEATKKTWFIVEAYPLFAAIFGGCLICFTHCMRHLFFSPDVFLSKSNRANGMIENFRTGENWKGNVFRKMSHLKSNKEDPFRS